MAQIRLIWLILIALILGACSSTGIPRATPTVAPTVTPRSGTPIAQEPTRTTVFIPTNTQTPVTTATAIVTGESSTATLSASNTVEPTLTATDSPSNTPEPSQTATSTTTTTPTLTLTPTATMDVASTAQALQATETAVAEMILATEGAYFLQTATSEAQATAQALSRQASQTAIADAIIATESFFTAQTATASANNRASTQTAVADERAQAENLNATGTAVANAVQATETAFAQQQIEQADAQATISQLATNVASIPTIGPTPTPATPTFATLAPEQTVEAPLPTIENMPEIIGEGEAQDLGQTGEATATFVFPTLPPLNAQNGGTSLTIPQPQIPPPSNFTVTNFTTRNFTIGEVIPLGQGAVGVTTGYGDAIPRLFARNPANPNQFVQTSHTGALYVNTNGSDYMPDRPFSEYTALIDNSAENQYFVSAVAWSGNGRYVAFVVDARRGGNTSATGEDGVHVLDTYNGSVRTLVRDCPFEGHPGCMIGGERGFFGSTSELHWSPDSTHLIVRQQTIERNGVLYITPLSQSPDVQPNALGFEFGTWTRDGQRIVVSGRTHEGNPIIGTINPDNTDLQVILDGNALGLWIQHAVQRPNGSFVALGRPNGEVAVRIIDQNGNFLTGPIGNAPPQSVTWSADRSAVTVIAGGVQYIAFVNGQVQTVTVTGDAPPPPVVDPPAEAQQPVEPAVPPLGQTTNEGGIYSVGQQLQIQSEVLNIRSGASVNDAPVRDPLQQGEYVRVVGGPVENDGFEWWQVMTADGSQGWIVSMIGVGHTFRPAD